jgi:hypothetical protein
MKAKSDEICVPAQAERMRIRQYVQSGERKTVNQVIGRFGEGKLVKGTFGRMFAHKQNWRIEGFKPDPNDAAEAKGQESERPASIRIGDAVIREHLHSDCVIEPQEPWESTLLRAVNDGNCTGCGEHVTREMQNDLKLSKEVRCDRCRVWLFGRGE